MRIAGETEPGRDWYCECKTVRVLVSLPYPGAFPAEEAMKVFAPSLLFGGDGDIRHWNRC